MKNKEEQNIIDEYKAEINRFAKENLSDDQYSNVFNQTMWDKSAEFGLFGLTIDEKYSGLGENFSVAAAVFEELGYACHNNGFIYAICNHVWGVLNTINRFGNEIQKEKYLPSMIEGRLKGALALRESAESLDSLSMQTTINEEHDCFLLNGSKVFVSNGPIADVFLVYGISSIEKDSKMTVLIVDKTLTGVSCGPNIKKTGLNACPTSDVSFDNVRVPKENLLGEIHRGELLMRNTLDCKHYYEYASYVGSMKYILEKSYTYSEERKQFGKSISHFQAVSHKISEMKISLEMSKLMLYQIGMIKDEDGETTLNTSIFKVYVSENYIKTCRDAMQIFGAYGYTKEYGIERELRDAFAGALYSEMNEMQKDMIFDYLK